MSQASYRAKARNRRERSCRGRRRYRDQPEAVEALRTLNRESTRRTVPVRAYECDRCHGWHLTVMRDPLDRVTILGEG